MALTGPDDALVRSLQRSRGGPMGSIRSKLITFAAVAAAAVSGAAIATAATSGNSSSPGATTTQERGDHDGPRGGHSVDGKTEKALTGDVASKVRAAALAKVPGTVERVETN